MVITTCRWTPDTCSENLSDNCQIEYDIDSTIPGSASNFRRVRTCAFHSNLTGTEDQIIQNITSENQRGFGNVSYHIAQAGPASLVDTQTNGQKVFKQGVTLTWNWTGIAPNRILNINVVLGSITLTTNQKNAIQSAVDTKFGIGNVLITYG